LTSAGNEFQLWLGIRIVQKCTSSQSLHFIRRYAEPQLSRQLRAQASATEFLDNRLHFFSVRTLIPDMRFKLSDSSFAARAHN
jgi:hypothetical protein